jgi:hypothetical protein
LVSGFNHCLVMPNALVLRQDGRQFGGRQAGVWLARVFGNANVKQHDSSCLRFDVNRLPDFDK